MPRRLVEGVGKLSSVGGGALAILAKNTTLIVKISLSYVVAPSRVIRAKLSRPRCQSGLTNIASISLGAWDESRSPHTMQHNSIE